MQAQEGLILEFDKSLEVRIQTMKSGAPLGGNPAHHFATAASDPGISVGLSNIRDEKGFLKSYQPQAAHVFQQIGVSYLKAALAAPSEESRQSSLANASHALEASRVLMKPFIAMDPEYRLSGQQHAESGDESGNVIQHRATVGRRQRHEAIKGVFAGTLSAIGRLAIAEGNNTDAACLGDAHDYYFASSDKVGQARNVMYMLMAERSRGSNRLFQVGYNVLRLSWALTAALPRRQWGAWRMAGSMAKYVLTQERAKAGLQDWHAV